MRSSAKRPSSTAIQLWDPEKSKDILNFDSSLVPFKRGNLGRTGIEINATGSGCPKLLALCPYPAAQKGGGN
jgi:hypothetical protein